LEGNMDDVKRVAEQFTAGGRVFDVREHGNGNINDTYLVTVDEQEEDHFVLQRINVHVFTRPKRIVHNLRVFEKHVQGRLMAENNGSNPRHWDVPSVRSTRDGQDYYIDPRGGFWRAISFVNHSQSYETVQSENHAREAGYALGRFQSLVSDLNIELLYDTLEGFHITPHYLSQYDATMAKGPRDEDSPEIRYCHRMVAERREWLAVLEDAKAVGKLKMRTIHGDPKINNIMICDHTGQAISLIDLDTVKPGLVHYDIGDCLRSSCNPLGEDTLDFDNVRFEIDLAQAILDGYVSVASQFLTEDDYAYIYNAIRLLAFECGLRFFADYLAGDVYFKVKHPEHNLHRAIVQFKLTENIEAQVRAIRAMIDDLKIAVV
jgi:Ser/Thr protein kinase RdoA (MazF antagonist)